MSVITLLGVVAAHTERHAFTARQLSALPEGYRTLERITGAGGKATKQGASLPLAGIRHIDAACPLLVKHAERVGTDVRMAAKHNGGNLRRSTVPCPSCFPAFYKREEERATKRGKVYRFDADTLRMIVADAPAPTPKRKRAAKK